MDRKIARIIPKVPIHPLSQFPLLSPDINMVYLPKLMKQRWRVITNKVLAWLRFLTFYQMPFLCPGSHPHHIVFSHHVSLGCSWLWQFLKLLLFWVTLTVWRSTDQVFCKLSLSWDLSEVFLVIIRLGLWGFGKTTEVSALSSHPIKGTCYQHGFSPMLLISPGWAS